MKSLFKGKRGNFVDIPEYIYFALTFAVLTTFTLIFINNWDDEIQLKDESIVFNESKSASEGVRNAVPTGLDYLFLFGTLIFFVSSIIFARLIPSSPKFIFITVILLIIFPIVAMVIENVWDGFNQSTTVSGATSSMIFMPFLLNNLVYVVSLYTLLVGIALYTKEETG